MVDHMRKMHLRCWWICPANIESPGSCGWKGTRDHTHVPQHVKRWHPELPWPPSVYKDSISCLVSVLTMIWIDRKINRDTAPTQDASEEPAAPSPSCSKPKVSEKEGGCPRPPRRVD
ncbi:hypothetical protein NUW54_g7435 [Trametes sanguinea]|uniref:Uncharacterized protein n=1 Tax=Trametes sanguinea TaxID=158606 RepID=A0ACC1PN54_9APHY|nr:hypothetical protein NUW54_g7435 [Trametes sanguinea]